MKTTYEEIEIAYDENKNEWVFDMAGKTHSFGSLKECKERIDKKPVSKRKTEFFKAFIVGSVGYSGSSDFVNEVKCGAYKKKTWGTGYEVWTTQGSDRRALNADLIYADTETNIEKFNKYNALVTEKKAIEKKISELRDSFEKISFNPDEE